jgi:hypothetical protein
MRSVTLRVIHAAAAGLIIVLLGAEPAPAALAPYFEAFDHDLQANGAPRNFVETPHSSWIAGSGFYQGAVATNGSGVPALASSSINLTNVAGHNFTVRARFTAVSYGLWDFRFASVGLVVLADNPDVTTGGYLLRWESAGLLDVHNKVFLERTMTPTLGNVGASRIVPPRGEREFTMTLRGMYKNGSLHLTGTLTTGGKRVSVEVTDPTPLTGTYFGFRLNASVSADHVSSITATYHEFSVTLDP